MFAASNSKLKSISKVSELMLKEKLLTNPVIPVSVSLSGNVVNGSGTLALSKLRAFPLEPNIKGILKPSSLVEFSSIACVHVPPAASQSVLFLCVAILQVPR